MLTFYDNIIFIQRQISTTLAEMSDLSLLWKLQKTGWPQHRENRENREFGSYFFQTGKTQGILLWHREKIETQGKYFSVTQGKI